MSTVWKPAAREGDEVFWELQWTGLATVDLAQIHSRSVSVGHVLAIWRNDRGAYGCFRRIGCNSLFDYWISGTRVDAPQDSPGENSDSECGHDEVRAATPLQ